MELNADDKKCVTGDLNNFSIFDITHTLMMSRKTALVTVQEKTKRGYVYFEDGQIVSALDDDLNIGEKAAFKIFLWRGGVFKIEFDAKPKERNIKLDTENLLLEIARNMDEHQRDSARTGGSGNDASAIETRFEDRFHNELNKVFEQVGTSASPSRARYTITAFDSLLVALNDLSGSALFIRPNSRPRIKTESGFTTIKQETITAGEIHGFLNALLSTSERSDFDEYKETSVYYSAERAGTFQVRAFYDYGRPALIFSPASRSIPPLARLEGDTDGLVAQLETKKGLLVITGPLASGKTTVLASVLEAGLEQKDLLITLFSKTHTYEFSDECGFLIRAAVNRFSLGIDGSLQAAIEQGSDLIAVDEITEGGMFCDAVSVATRSSLVIALVEAENLRELGERMRALASGPEQERFLERLGGSLRGVIEADLGTTGVKWHPATAELTANLVGSRPTPAIPVGV